MVLFVISLLFLIVGFVCQARLSKLILWISGALTALAASAFFWTETQLTASGCQRNAVEGLVCPDPSLLTNVAILHSSIAIFALAAGVFAAPAITLAALWIEARHRRQSRDA